MNKDIFKGEWHELKGKIKQKWNKLTDDEIEQVKGKGEELYGLLQKHYGYTKDEVDKAVEELNH